MINQKELALVSLSSMNEVHFEEVDLLNALLEQLNNEAGFEMLCESFQILLEHMHDKVLNQTRYAEMQWRNRKDEDALREYLEGDIVPWLDQHIKAMDTPMADYVSNNLRLSKH